MERLDRIGGLVHELVDLTAIVDRLVLLHGALDGHTFLVYDDDAQHAHMRVDPVQRLFYFLGG